MSEEGSLLYNKMRKTWEKCLSANYSFDSSIKYQQEEYALLLCKEEFQHLIYPKRVTNAMAFIYKNCDEKKPQYHHIKITECRAGEQTMPDKSGTLKKERRHMHVAFQAVIEHIEMLLNSHQMSEKSKRVFLEELENTVLIKSATLASMGELDKDDLPGANTIIQQ